MSKSKTSSSSGSSGIQLSSSGSSNSIGAGVASSRSANGKKSSDSSVRELQALRVRADDDSDYEEDGPEDDSLDIARRTHNQHLSDAFKDGFREGFDKGQIQLAQNVFNTSHSLAAKSQVPYGQYLGIVKVLDQKLSSSPNAEDLCNFISKTEALNCPPMNTASTSSSKTTMTKSALLERLSQLKNLKTVHANEQLVTFISEIETRLSSVHK